MATYPIVMGAAAAGLCGVLSLVLPLFWHSSAVVPAKTEIVALIFMSTPVILTVAASIHIGLLLGQRSILHYAVRLAVGRAVAGAVVVVTAIMVGRLEWVALAWGTVASIPPLTLILGHRLGGRARPNRANDSQRMRASVRGICLRYSAWSVSGFLIVGMNTSIVAHDDPRNVGVYATAASIPVVIQATVGTISQARIPDYVQRAALGFGHLRAYLIRASATTTLLLVFGGTLLVDTSAYVEHALSNKSGRAVDLLPVLLVVAACIRQVYTPITTAIIATGEQARVVFVPLVEVAATAVGALALGAAFGAGGVAGAVVFGAVASVTANTVLALPRIRSWEAPTKAELLRQEARLLIGLSPAVAASAISSSILKNCLLVGSLVVPGVLALHVRRLRRNTSSSGGGPG